MGGRGSGRWAGRRSPWRAAGIPWSLLACLLLAPLAGAQDNADRPPGPPSGTYRRPLGNDPATLDPARISDIYSLSVTHQIFDGLVRFDQTLTISPALAQHWRSSRDGLTWTLMLRKGVKFHHGREVTADDVVYSITRILDPKTASGAADLFTGIKGAQEFMRGQAKTVAGLSAVDRYTVQVVLNDAPTPFVSVLAVGHAKIVPKDLVEQLGDAFGMQPVGTGPFKFVRWDRGKEIVLAANTESFDGSPRLARLIYRIFPGETSDLICQEFGHGDLEESPVPPKCRAKVTDPRYQYFRRPTFSVRFYGFNTRVKPLGDVHVRQAIAHALDRETVLRDVFLGQHQPARGILPTGMPGYNPQLAGLTYNPARSRELLKQAGFPEGRGLPTIAIWSGTKGERIDKELAGLKRQLAAVGISAEIQYETDWPAFSRRIADGRAPMFVYAWHADVPDPDNFLFKLFHSQSPRNLTGYANPIVDDLLFQARRERDAVRRIEIYRRAEQIIVNEAPVVPVWHYTFERLFQSYVRNVEVNGLGDAYLPLRKMWLEPQW
jgi:peptide/nickel transport system substrate-binding protein/oligopeptide transport system substrate-binding protein